MVHIYTRVENVFLDLMEFTDPLVCCRWFGMLKKLANTKEDSANISSLKVRISFCLSKDKLNVQSAKALLQIVDVAFGKYEMVVYKDTDPV